LFSIVVASDPTWPSQFEDERRRLEPALGPWLEGGIHHIGSTSVPGLAAKPIIDMMAGVRELDGARATFGSLEALGYTYRPHRPEAHRFSRMAHDTPLGATHHLHLTEPGSDLWRERLAFRDALRRDPALRDEYADWKRRHAASDPADGSYTADKRLLVLRVLAEQGISLKPDSERLDPRHLEGRSKRL
jgi:GrpB-like predicted nucleotidyltransferase (UPF0157 family)